MRSFFLFLFFLLTSFFFIFSFQLLLLCFLVMSLSDWTRKEIEQAQLLTSHLGCLCSQARKKGVRWQMSSLFTLMAGWAKSSLTTSIWFLSQAMVRRVSSQRFWWLMLWPGLSLNRAWKTSSWLVAAACLSLWSRGVKKSLMDNEGRKEEWKEVWQKWCQLLIGLECWRKLVLAGKKF